jgi:hypothetical protein
MIRDVIHSASLVTSQMAAAAECSQPSTNSIRNNLRLFGNVRAPSTRVGRRRRIAPQMMQTLCDNPLEKPGLYGNKMVFFLWDGCYIRVTSPSIKRALASSARRKRWPDREQRNRMLVCEIYMSTVYHSLSHNI